MQWALVWAMPVLYLFCSFSGLNLRTVEPAATSANLESHLFGISDFEGNDDEEISQFWARAAAFKSMNDKCLHLMAVEKNRGE